jgi:thioredoxin 1/putative thioredoxin
MTTTSFTEFRWTNTTERTLSGLLREHRDGYILFWIDDPESELCREMESDLHEFAGDFHEKVQFARIDFVVRRRLAAALGTRSAPAVALVENGRVVRAAHGPLVPVALNDIASKFLQPNLDIGEIVPVRRVHIMLCKRQIALVDVRDAAAFGRAHIPGAICASYAEIKELTAKYAQRKWPRPVVFYDRDGGAVARMALDIPRTRGLRCGMLEGGFIAWEAAGLPVERL